MFSLSQYLRSLEDPHGLVRTLGEIEVCRDAAGRMLYTAGNSAAVFRIRCGGRIRSLRCYLRPVPRLREIYGERLLERELYLFTSPCTGVWADVVVGDWIEGATLREEIDRAAAAGDAERLAALGGAFDRMARALVSDDRAHGELKPENIIVDSAGRLHAIDLDASFLPAFAGARSPELGTASYQHPARTADDFDASLDDYPAALIATALHALRLDPSLAGRYRDVDGLLFDPQRRDTDPALREALELFERHGLAAQYRVAQLLRAPTLRLPGLAALLDRAAAELERGPAAESERGSAASGDAVPELFVERGLWGYRSGGEVVVPALYDCGFEFSERLAAVRLGRTWHYIDAAGRVRIRCPECEAVKPFRDGRAVVLRGGRRLRIDIEGREFAV